MSFATKTGTQFARRRVAPWFAALALAALLFAALSPLAAQAQTQDRWVAPDKFLHLVAGTAIAGAGTFVFDDARAGFALGCGAGALKEIYDAQHRDIHTPSWKDFAVACLGAGMGAAGMRWMLARQAGVTTVTLALEF